MSKWSFTDTMVQNEDERMEKNLDVPTKQNKGMRL